MRTLRQLLFSALVVTSMVGLGHDADASRTAGARPTRQRTNQQRPARAARPAPKPGAQSNAASGLKDKVHLAAVKARVNHWKNVVQNGESDGNQVYFHAAGAELISTRGIKQTEVHGVSYGEGRDRSQRIRVSGIKDGKWRGHLVGWVSTHDLASLDWPQYTAAVNKRVTADRIQVSYDHGPGTARTVLVKGLKGAEATAVPIEVPLNKSGITRIIYDRTDSSGYRVGSSDAYVGRIVEIEQAGN